MSYSGIQRASPNFRPTPRTGVIQSTPNRSRPTYDQSPNTTSNASPAYSSTSAPRRGPSTPSIQPSPRTVPVNALTAAFDANKSVEARRQEALAQKRRREIESAPGFKDMAREIKKYKYTGPDPRDQVTDTRAGSSGNEGRERQEVKGESKRDEGREIRQGRGDDGRGGSRVGRIREPVQEGGATDEQEDDDDKDDLFDSILSSKSQGKSKTHYLTDTIKPFRVLQSTASHPATRPPPQDQQQLRPAPRIQLHNPPKSKTTLPRPIIQHYNHPGSSRPTIVKAKVGLSYPEEKPKKKKQPSRWNPPPPVPDPYADDDFDQLLASTTTFDDGTDIYADPAFDDALEAALASGVGW